MKKALLLLALCALSLPAQIIGNRVSSWALPDATGRYYDILDFRGKVLLIDIMKTDCPHCATLSRAIERIKTRYAGKLNVVSVVNPPDNPNTVANYIARHKVTNPILFDFGQATAGMLKITPQNPSISLPHVLIVDANGIVQFSMAYNDKQKAIFEGDGLAAVIDKVLAGKRP